MTVNRRPHCSAATLLPWRPQQLILLVNEQTLLPVVMPLAPGATAPARIGPEIAAALAWLPTKRRRLSSTPS